MVNESTHIQLQSMVMGVFATEELVGRSSTMTSAPKKKWIQHYMQGITAHFFLPSPQPCSSDARSGAKGTLPFPPCDLFVLGNGPGTVVARAQPLACVCVRESIDLNT